MRLPRKTPLFPVAPALFGLLLAFARYAPAVEPAARMAVSLDSPGKYIVFTPANLSFGKVIVGKRKLQTITITNVGKSDSTLLRVISKGPEFALNGLDLPLTLATGESFTFRGVFAPRSRGMASGSISLAWGKSGMENSIATFGMTGVGADEQLTVDPATMDFGSVQIGTTSSQGGKLTAPNSQVTVSAAVSSSSQFRCMGLSFPFTIPPGGSQGFTVMFLPQPGTAASATLSFLDENGNTLAVENLTGSGIVGQSHRVDLSWNASTSQDVIGYNVYRGNTSGGPYQQINSVLDPSTVYSDTSVTDGDTYYYVATAVNSSEQESVYSNEAQAVIPDDGSQTARPERRPIVTGSPFARRIAGVRPVASRR